MTPIRARRVFSVCCLMLTMTMAGAHDASAQNPAAGEKWAATWAASPHGPYPSGNPSAQPDLSLALPANMARDQTFRMMVRPDLWGRAVRIRLTNVFGTAPITFDDVFVGLQAMG